MSLIANSNIFELRDFCPERLHNIRTGGVRVVHRFVASYMHWFLSLWIVKDCIADGMNMNEVRHKKRSGDRPVR